MIAQTLRVPHNLYRRYQAYLESIVTALGFAGLVTITLYALPVYPENWALVIGIAIAIMAVRWPPIAYFVAVGVMIYPIYTINLYLSVLFIAITALGQRTFTYYMGATVLVLSTPILAEYHLHWLIPVLGGLWWGGAIGAWVGGLAAIWGKLLGGIGGLDIDWLVMAGQTPDVQVIITNFQNSNSLQTLLILVEPFATTPNVLLYNLLQVMGWVVAAAFIGSMADRKWVKYHIPWSILVITAGSGLIMLVTHLALPYWLQEAVTPETVAVLQNPVGSLFSLITVIVVGTTMHSLRESLELPVAPKNNIRRKRKGRDKKQPTGRWKPANLFRRSKATPEPVTENNSDEIDKIIEINDSNQTRQPVRIPILPEWEPPQEESGLIMLEID